MNKFKKIGLTALAGSLVATSAYAGAVSVAGGASMGVKNNSGTDGGKSWTMGNQLTFSGGGELDNGLNVSISFVLDQGDGVTDTTAPFDNHSITVSSDTLGSVTMAGEGASSAHSALDTTAAGDIFDNGFGISSPASSDAASGSLLYTLPSIMDDLTLTASYSGGTTAVESTTAIGVTYTGVEGLSVSYGAGEKGSTASNASADATTLKASYAYGSFTAAVSNTEIDYDAAAGEDDEISSWKVSYTVTDDLSISYGEETHETNGDAIDEEVEQISASYTTGGMTVSLSQTEATGADHSTSLGTQERWKLGLSFAF
ncbi:porin [Candidatus Pelagibacter bacterium]|nr:porin [Candidatus Pelagibacter bacterium]